MSDQSNRSAMERIALHPRSRRELFRLLAGGAAVATGAVAMGPAVSARQGTPGGKATIVTSANPASWDLTNTTWPT